MSEFGEIESQESGSDILGLGAEARTQSAEDIAVGDEPPIKKRRQQKVEGFITFFLLFNLLNYCKD